MEARGSQSSLQVLGENEALQQFFNGQDVSGVLENPVTVDTTILEQYLSTDMDPSSFMLPESPPDSSSEPCSPPQIPDLQNKASYWSTQQDNQEMFHPLARPATSLSCRFKGQSPAFDHFELPTHAQLCGMGLTDTYIRVGCPPAPAAHQHTHQSPIHTHHLSPDNYTQVYTPPTPLLHDALPLPLHSPAHPAPQLAPADSFPGPHSAPTRLLGLAGDLTATPGPVQSHSPSAPACILAHNPAHKTRSPVQLDSKRRRRSESCQSSSDPGLLSEGVDASCCDSDGTAGGSSVGGLVLGTYQLLTWKQYKQEQWSTLYDSRHQTLPAPGYQVDTDKGFNFSAADDAFICQKKNHFQVTVHIGVAGEPCYVKTPSGPQEIDHFLVRVFGVKVEAPDHHVTIEQSQSDRSKRAFYPVSISLPGNKITKVTLGRLHFSETTANNMRKKGKPNPDQRYFLLVVGLYAVVREDSFLLTALMSERIIVRASNPGQFEMDSDTTWQRGVVQDTVVCQGRVGINTDSPDEALVVCGNAKVMGTVMHPSDRRAKHNIQEVDSEEQLKRIAQMRIVEYDYKPQFASTMGIDKVHQRGIIAQEVKELLPAAVKEVGDVICSDGEQIHNFLMVDKEQIFIENVGAVKQLCKLTDNLENRIKELEVWNNRLAKLKSLSGSLHSKGKPSINPSVPTPQKPDPRHPEKVCWNEPYGQCLQHKVLQASIFTLLTTMAFCVISITALYLSTLREDNGVFPGSSNDSVFPQLTTTAWTTTASPPPGLWPPDVSFCELLYCEQVYCCPSTPGGAADTNITSVTAEPAGDDPSLTDRSNDKLSEKLKNAKDWTNTTIKSFLVKENQQVIDSRYCDRHSCGSGRYSYLVPISPYVPVNMRVTLIMNSTELLVVHLCSFDESAACSALLDMDTITGTRYPSNTQGEHQWPLHVARLHQSSYHFRSTVAGQADCSTDRIYAGALYTDYHFHFYRRCTD
ncbi:myelin regulatory factor-like protein [Lampris incognitus]|uniref:myelin regulatory factor-like protein n=1 Tax=Lampris incognitus TaxID=2546036 RepID=UPI0024B4C449|nr:myelin regulatory factor-like protein [Lampris incognitus]